MAYEAQYDLLAKNQPLSAVNRSTADDRQHILQSIEAVAMRDSCGEGSCGPWAREGHGKAVHGAISGN